MNSPIRRVAAGFMVLFTLLLANVTYVQAFQAEELNARSDNRRVLLDEYARERGAILVGSDAIAKSVPTDGQFKYLRQYPGAERYAGVTGYYSYIYGRAAMERAQNGVLSGSDSRLFVRRVVDLVTGTQVRGGNVVLTLNPKAQQAAFEGLDGKKGAVVAIDPRTGAILAMANQPSYDPNPLASHNSATQTEAWKTLNDNPDKPMLNRAIARTYPPGSTFKLVTAAAALESGKYTPATEVPGPPGLQLPDSTHVLTNHDKRACGPNDKTTLTNALRISCNTAFASIGMELGAEALLEQAGKFGFNSDALPDMQAAQSVFPSDIDAAQTALSAIGQFDVRATPLQMAMVAAAIANRGVLMEPYLVSEVLGPDLAPIETARPSEQSEAMSPQTARDLTAMMVEVVNNGTGRNAQIDGIPVAGKTGTAQHAEGERPYAWFTAFAPADDPRVAVAVVVEDAGDNTEVSGNRLAAPIARAVMEAVLAS